jgi:BolA family transcriptional regulator, general stress-responsive regulator
MTESTRIDRLRQALEHAFNPLRLELIDESHLHRGHAGAQTGKGHFRLEIVAAAFDGLAPLARHRLVYQALAELMSEIHALSITARTPREHADS